MIRQRLLGRLAGLAMAVTLLATSAGQLVQPASAASAASQPPAAVRSPLRLIGTPAGWRYASPASPHDRAALARTSTPGSKLPPLVTTKPVQQQRPDAIRPLAAPAPTPYVLTAAPDNHAPGFAGLAATDQTSPTTEPADSTVAVGPDHVVQLANLVMRITNRAGVLSGSDVAVPDLFLLPAGYFDRQPRVVYDSLHGRFVITETTWNCDINAFPGDTALFGHGFADLAVSRTSDPNGAWDLYYWGYTDQVPADPSIGTSTDKLAISSNLSAMTHGDGGLSDGSCANPSSLTALGGDALVVSWADAVAHKTHTPLADEYFSDLTDTSLGGVLGLRAALQEPATSPTLYLVGRAETAGSVSGQLPQDVIVTALSGIPAAPTQVFVSGSWNLTKDSIVAPFGDPPAPHQPGSPATIVNAVDGYPQDALWQAGKLTWATTYPCTPGGDSSARDCVRVTQVDTSLASVSVDPTEAQDVTVARNGFDTYQPGLGISGDGTLELVYSQSSLGSDYPSSWQQYQRPADPANNLSAPVLLSAGTNTYPGTAWGTYVGLGQDPRIASAVWQANAFSLGAAYWSTFVDQLGVPTGSTFTPITPTRIVDTRDGVSGLSHLVGKFVSGIPRTFPVVNLGPGPVIPVGAVAITGNVTVTRQNGAGYVAVTPTPQSNPTSSSLNFPVGDNRANNVTVPLAANGSLSITYIASSGRTTDVLLDVTGYFMPDDSAATYHPVGPIRLLNSVTGTGQPGGIRARFKTRVAQTFTIGTGSPVPAAAIAITGNLTVTRQSKAGYLAITPDPDPLLRSSTLNFPLADDRANGFTAQLNSSHQLSIVYVATAAGATTDVILDVTGYYLPDLSGLHYYPLSPGRILDTRPGVADSGLTGPFASSVPRSLAVASHWGVPAGAQAITGNLTVVGQTTRGYVSATTVSNANPGTSTLNFPVGDTRANGMSVPLGGSGSLFLVFKGTSGTARTNLIVDVSGYFK